jgi:hypothetical protein
MDKGVFYSLQKQAELNQFLNELQKKQFFCREQFGQISLTRTRGLA